MSPLWGFRGVDLVFYTHVAPLGLYELIRHSYRHANPLECKNISRISALKETVGVQRAQRSTNLYQPKLLGRVDIYVKLSVIVGARFPRLLPYGGWGLQTIMG